MLFILEPISYISSSVAVLILAMAVSFIIEPLPFIDVTISMDEGALAICFVHLPVSVILGAVLPDLLAIPILHSIQEVSGVDSPIGECDGPVSLSLIVIYHLGGNAIVIIVHVPTLSVVVLWASRHHHWAGEVVHHHVLVVIMAIALHI